MYENDTTANATVSGRSVFETASEMIVRLTVLGGLGPGRGTVASDGESLRAILRERNEEYIAIEVWFPAETYDEIRPRHDVYLGDPEQFVVRHDEDKVSLPEEPEQLATPVEMDFENPHEVTIYFRTEDVDFSKIADFVGSNYIEMGLGVFPERTIPADGWDTSTTFSLPDRFDTGIRLP